MDKLGIFIGSGANKGVTSTFHFMKNVDVTPMPPHLKLPAS